MRLWTRRETAPPTPDAPAAEVDVPMFVCRTCRRHNKIYAAREVVNWNRLGDFNRRPDGSIAFATYRIFLAGDPGPPLRYVCTGCDTYADELEELIEGRDEILLREVSD